MFYLHTVLFILLISYVNFTESQTTEEQCNIPEVTNCISKIQRPSDNVDYATACRSIHTYRECIDHYRDACINDPTMGNTITILDTTLKAFDQYCGDGSGTGDNDTTTATNAACDIQAVTACLGKYTAPSDLNNVDYAALCRSIGEYRDCIKPLRPACTNDPNMGSTITALDEGFKAFDSHCNGGTGGGSGTGGGTNDAQTVTFPAILINLLALLATVVVLM